MRSKLPAAVGVVLLIALALVGWIVLFAQRPDILLQARLRFREAIQKKVDLSTGPCLGQIAPDWVLDIAHLPRQPIDDLPQNQCREYRLGRIHHFVEMTPRGEIIIVN